MRCVLHVGMPKTGTTAVQSALAANRSGLKERGVVYSTTFSKRYLHSDFASRVLADFSVPPNARYNPERQAMQERGARPGFAQEVDRALDREIRAARRGSGGRALHSYIISSELLYDFLHSPPIARLARSYLERRFEQTLVVVYLRRPDLHLVSSYGQGMKDGRFTSWAENERRKLDGSRFLYHQRLSRLAETFGRENVRARVYEREQLCGGSTVTDLLAVAGLDDVAGLDLASTLRADNVAWDRETMAFFEALERHMRLYNKRDNLSSRARTIRRWLDEMPRSGNPVQISHQRAEEILARFADEYAAAARDFFGRDDGILFRDPLPSGEDMLLAEPDAEANVRIAAYLLERERTQSVGERAVAKLRSIRRPR